MIEFPTRARAFRLFARSRRTRFKRRPHPTFDNKHANFSLLNLTSYHIIASQSVLKASTHNFWRRERSVKTLASCVEVFCNIYPKLTVRESFGCKRARAFDSAAFTRHTKSRFGRSLQPAHAGR